jgi:DMSO/TMAO reductase YedYZ molybdopterin-dependent catalytic subunit
MVRPTGASVTRWRRGLTERSRALAARTPSVEPRGPFRPGAFRSALRSPRLTSQLGLALAVTFGTCFVTGLLSHLIQHPPGWFWWPSRPTQLYRVTQGVHVATGLATIPLLVAKLWSVYPRLFRWPPVRDPLHALERASVAVLVAAALFQLITGLLNIALWYGPMPFYFPTAHYWTAWLVIGALVVHIGVKLPVVRQALSEPTPTLPAPAPARGTLTRRGLLGAVAAAAGAVTLATVGQTVGWLAPASVLAPRRPTTGPQRVPVNKSARAAGVADRVGDPAYRLVVEGPARTVALTLDELAALPQHSSALPITCVEGWSADAEWTGVRLRDLVALVGADPDRVEVRVESMQRGGLFRASTVAPPHVRDPLTLLALRLHGEPLHPDHGYPCRLIAPNRPGVLQTKWVARIVVRP